MPAVAADRRALLTRVPPRLNEEVEDFCQAQPGGMTKTDALEILIRRGLQAEARRRRPKPAPTTESATT